MRAYYAAVAVAALFTVDGIAQAGSDILPWSIRTGTDLSNVPVVHSTPFDAEAVHDDDHRRAEAGKLPLYGRMQQLGATLNSNGLWSSLSNGDRFWRLKIIAEGALGIDLFFEDFHLPPGALFHVYDPAGSLIHGAYTPEDVLASGYFTTPLIFGESCIVEYFEPFAVRGEGHFTIPHIAYAYRMVSHGDRASDTCEVDVNCSEGIGWEEQRDAVVRVRVVEDAGVGWCSGVLMNNTSQNCAPYILTAFHCGESSNNTHFDQYVFRFRYQRQGCDEGFTTQGNDKIGCIRRADSNDGGGSSGSDFMLLELNSPIAESHEPFYAGWSAANVAVPNGKGIHHPAGDRKKISTFTSALQTTTWGNANGSHWRVVWSATANGHGVTEGGSSGSPIFDQNKRVIGTLTGGSSCCSVNGCGSFTSPNAPDLYGKMSHHWSGNPNPPSEKLREWLAPGSSSTTFDGSYSPCGIIGIDENSKDQRTSVFPNPSNDGFTVQYPYGIVRADRIEVTDLAGRLVYAESPLSSGSARINAQGWSSGTYLVNVIAAGVKHAGAKVTVEGN